MAATWPETVQQSCLCSVFKLKRSPFSHFVFPSYQLLSELWCFIFVVQTCLLLVFCWSWTLQLPWQHLDPNCPSSKSPSSASTTSQVRGSRVLCNGGGAERTAQIAASGTEIAQLLSPFSMHPTSFERTRCFLENLEPLFHSSFTAHPFRLHSPFSSLFFFSCLLLSFSPLEERARAGIPSQAVALSATVFPSEAH